VLYHGAMSKAEIVILSTACTLLGRCGQETVQAEIMQVARLEAE
jgi:hypothetical protein